MTNDKKELKQLLKEAKKGDVVAQRKVGKYYSDAGRHDKAVKWFKLAA